MKKIVKAVGLSAVVLGSAAFANAAEAAEKIGVVSTEYILNKMPQKDAVVAKLQSELKDDGAELQKIKADITTKIEKIKRDGELLGEEAIQQLEIEIGQLQAKGQIKQEAFNKKRQALNFKARQEMLVLIQKAATKIAEQEGFDMIVDGQTVLYLDKKSDLTEKVLAELK